MADAEEKPEGEGEGEPAPPKEPQLPLNPLVEHPGTLLMLLQVPNTKPRSPTLPYPHTPKV